MALTSSVTNSLFIPRCKRAESDKRDSTGFEDETPVTIINCRQPWENGLPLLSLPKGEVKQKHDPSPQCRTVPSKKRSSLCSEEDRDQNGAYERKHNGNCELHGLAMVVPMSGFRQSADARFRHKTQVKQLVEGQKKQKHRSQTPQEGIRREFRLSSGSPP